MAVAGTSDRRGRLPMAATINIMTPPYVRTSPALIACCSGSIAMTSPRNRTWSSSVARWCLAPPSFTSSSIVEA
jgi:hypothetical protein